MPGGPRSEACDAREVEAFQEERTVIALDGVADIERAVPHLGADVVAEVHRTVHVNVHPVALVALVDALRDLEACHLGGDRDVGRRVEADDAAQRRDGSRGAREIVIQGVLQVDPRVRVLDVQDEPGKPAIAVDEVVLVAEPVSFPVERGVDRQVDLVADPVERDVALEDRFGRVADRDVVEEELVLPGGTQDQVDVGEPLLSEAQVGDRVDAVTGDAERLARHHEVRRRVPQPEPRLHMVFLAGGRVTDRIAAVLRAGGRDGHRRRDDKGREAENHSRHDRPVLIPPRTAVMHVHHDHRRDGQVTAALLGARMPGACWEKADEG